MHARRGWLSLRSWPVVASASFPCSSRHVISSTRYTRSVPHMPATSDNARAYACPAAVAASSSPAP
eukprot:353852-Chlamydomonas_euryale.AAC.2